MFLSPFLIPLLLLRSKRLNDVVLKLQYSVLMMTYAVLGGLLLVVCSPVLYGLLLVNSSFILLKGRDKLLQRVVQFVVSLVCGPVVVLASILVDMLNLPKALFQETDYFEYKYQYTDQPISAQQTQVLHSLFEKFLYGSLQYKFRSGSLSLNDLVLIHWEKFQLINRLHDLVCRGTKDYHQSLSVVQDFNLMKSLSKRLSFPDINGNNKESRVVIETMRHLFDDLDLYNFVDVVFRKHQMAELRPEILKAEANKNVLSYDLMGYLKSDKNHIDYLGTTANGTLVPLPGPDG